MPLQWSDVQQPNPDIQYTHVVAMTPLGRIVLEWKGWKESDPPCGTMPWGDFILGIDLEDAKQQVQSAFDQVVAQCLDHCTTNRVTVLEDAIRSITFADDGQVFPSFRDHFDLARVAPVLTDVHKRN